MPLWKIYQSKKNNLFKDHVKKNTNFPQFVRKILQKFLFGILSSIGKSDPESRIQNLMHKKGGKKLPLAIDCQLLKITPIRYSKNWQF